MMQAIEKPTLILNSAIAKRNIARMAEKARQSGVRFRPHYKTHQSAAIGEWFRAEGVTAITVSSVSMARYFADNGWTDILIAFPVNWLEIEQINQLAAQVTLGLLVESVESVHFLAQKLTAPADVWLKLDAGYGRTGVQWDDAETLAVLADAVREADHLTLKGLLAHSGHTYRVRKSHELVRAVWHETLTRMQAARDGLAEAGYTGLLLAPGDTPGCSVVEDLSGADEIRPGNFVFYDMTQVAIGACEAEDVAVAVACPVVAKHPARGTIVVYGGAVHLSKEGLTGLDGGVSFGAVALPSMDGWQPLQGCYVEGMSQEHGLIHATDDLMAQVSVGDVLMVLPVHSCLTADLLKAYRTLEGEAIAMARF